MARSESMRADATRNDGAVDVFAPLVDVHGVVLIDGAMGSLLEARGHDITSTPLWSAAVLVASPADVEQVHYDYFKAGADVATTCTYQVGFDSMAANGHDAARTRAHMEEAVACAHRARMRICAEQPTQARPLVAASLGSFGAVCADGSEFTGEYGDISDDELERFHAERVAVLSALPDVDVLAFETVPSEREARAIVRALGRSNVRGLGAWVSFSCADGAHTCSGDSIAACVRAVVPCAHVCAVGVNCTAPAHITALLTRMRACCGGKRLLAYPNSGLEWDSEQRGWRVPPGYSECGVARHVAEWAAAGATLLGGCCTTTPATIAAMHAARRK